MISFDVPPQEILTRDSVTVAVDAVVYFRISNPIWSVVNVEDAHRSTKLLAQTTLRNELGTKNLSEVDKPILLFFGVDTGPVPQNYVRYLFCVQVLDIEEEVLNHFI